MQPRLEPCDVVGQWAGRWQGANSHGGSLSCVIRQTGPRRWVALFTAECGGSHAYTVTLEGKSEVSLPGGEPAVLFGGEVDLGKDGIFIWTGRAADSEFHGVYEGGGGAGTFMMKRASSSEGPKR